MLMALAPAFMSTMTVSGFCKRAPERDAVPHADLIFNDRCLANHDAHRVIDKQALADQGGRVDINVIGLRAPVLQQNRERLFTRKPVSMRNAMGLNGMNSSKR